MVKYSKILFVFIALSMAATVTMGQQVEKRKQLTKQFYLAKPGTVSITNKYGKIDVTTWDKDSVKIVVKLTARAKNTEKLDKLMELIRFRFVATDDYLDVSTQIGSAKNDLISELADLTNAVFTIGSEAEIDYYVKVPANSKLNITNSFGDIYLQDKYKDATINLAHGDIRAEAIPGKAQLKIRFGKGYISSLDDAIVILEYADLSLQKADQLKLNTKSSDIDIENAGKIFLNSSRDKLKIGTIQSLSGKATLSKIYIEKLNLSADLETRLGAFTLAHVVAGFQKLFLISSYTDISLFFNKEASFTFFSRQTATEFYLPSGIEFTKVVIDKDKKVLEYSGTIGIKKTNLPDVRIDCTKGKLKMFFE